MLKQNLDRNPKYFDNPEEYVPARWYAMSNELDAISTFGLGEWPLL